MNMTMIKNGLKKRGLAVLLAVCIPVVSGVSVFAQGISTGALSNVHAYTLPSGQRVYIRENRAQPIVTIDTWVNVGSVNEVPQNNGVSHFLEHLLFKGTDQYAPGEIDRLLESKGSKFNAATSNDYTHYYITAASPFFEETLKLHASMLRRATLPPEELERERKVVQEEINRATDNPNFKRFSALSRLMYPGHGYGMETLGPKQNIADIPREDILAYYQHWYQPQNFNTVISGDVDPEQALALVQQYFEQPPAVASKASYTPPAVSAPPIIDKPRSTVLKDPGVSQAYVTLGFPAPSIEEREETYALDVAMMALGAGVSSRLYQELHEKNPLVRSIGAGNMTQKYAGLLYVDAEMKPENREKAKLEIFRQLQHLKERGITAEELDKAQTQTIKDFIFRNEATTDVAKGIGYNVTIGNLQDYTEYVANIQKVTLADVKDALTRYLDYNKAVIVELLPEDKKPVAAEERRNVALLEQARDGQLPLSAVSQVAESDSEATALVTETRLANGMTLLSKPTKGSQTVAIKIFVKGGQVAEAVPGVSSLMASSLLKGTTHRSAEALSQELESRGMGLSASSHEDFVEITATAISEDLGELFLVLQDVLTDPAFDPEEVEKIKSHLKQSIKASRDNPSSIAMENLAISLYPEHPYGHVGKRIEPHLEAITRDQLVDFYRQTFVPENMVVAVVGDFAPEVVQNYLESGAASLVGVAGATAAKVASPAPLVTPQRVEEQRPIKGATWIAQGWLAPPVNDQDYVPLKVLNSLLGTGMSSRLFVNLRDKQGLAYAVSSAYPSLANTSHFFLFIGTDPKNQETVLRGFNHEIDRLKTEPVPLEELEAAKDKLRGTFALQHETNSNQAFYLGFYEAIGVGHQFDEQYPGLIEQVTAEDIQRVANTYFSAPEVVSIVAPQAADEKQGVQKSGTAKRGK